MRAGGRRGAPRRAVSSRGSCSTRAARSPHDAFPGVAPPLGVVGVTEKGTTNLELRAEGRGGHSSMPSRMDTDRPDRARAILRLEHSPFPAARARADPGDARAGSRRTRPPPLRPLVANAHRLRPAAGARAGRRRAGDRRPDPHDDATVTTLPGSPALQRDRLDRAGAGVNLRVLVGDTVGLGRRARPPGGRATTRCRLEVLDANEPSPVSPSDDDAVPSCIDVDASRRCSRTRSPTPYVMMGATDSRFFTAICPRVYRFTPFRMTKAQRAEHPQLRRAPRRRRTSSAGDASGTAD